MKIVTDSVLAGAYAVNRSGRLNSKAHLTHSYDDDVSPRVSLCKRLGETATRSIFAGAHSDERPTCATCARRDPRFKS